MEAKLSIVKVRSVDIAISNGQHSSEWERDTCFVERA
jgi:hypothetical protein